VKKFITGAMKADYFTTLVRIEGQKGLTVIVIPANSKGIKLTRMKTMGWFVLFLLLSFSVAAV
jgi:alkylation response protein AidB-like acyl-CoA dehydrogenase